MAEYTAKSSAGGSSMFKGGGGIGSPPGNTGSAAYTRTGVNMGATTDGIAKDHIERRLAPAGEANAFTGSAFFKGGEEAG
jgi:hypothetical protein